MLDRLTTPDRIDFRALNAKAIKHWDILFFMLVDLHGHPTGEVQRLGNAGIVINPERPRSDGPRLLEFRGPGREGSWHCLGNGASGSDIVSLVEYLSECSRPVAADFLKRLTDRIVEIAA